MPVGIKDVKNSDNGNIPVMFIEKKTSTLTSRTPTPDEIAVNNFCLGSVCFCSTNVVPCTIYMLLLSLGNIVFIKMLRFDVLDELAF